MDPLHFCIAVAPLSVYLLMLGFLNLMGRPFVTTGARDAAALGIGISGMMIAGPMELFFPEAAASQYGSFVWILMISFYGLCVSLVVLLMRSRIVVYNINSEQLRPLLNQVAIGLDKKSRWTGDSLLIPDLNVHLHLEAVDWLRNVQLTSGGLNQSFEGWRKLENELRNGLATIRVGPNILGIGMLLASAALAVGSTAWMIAAPQSVAQSLDEILRR